MKRVVVTGLGAVTPVGVGARSAFDALCAGRSGARALTGFESDDLASRIACYVPRGKDDDALFDPDRFMAPKEQRKVDDFIIYAMAAAREALADCGWEPRSEAERCRTGVLIGSGIGGLSGIADTALTLDKAGPRRVSPFFISGRLINLASGYVSINHGLKGPNHAVVTACSSGAHAIGDAARLIALGDADVMVAGGAESPVCRIALAGFAACRALSTHYNDHPTAASRPYDSARDGFVIGEGAGVLILESLEHAQSRDARIYAEIAGYGLSGDAHHITAPPPDGDGAYRCMKAALERAGMTINDIDYINAHGTSTPLGDEVELQAVERLAGPDAGRLAMSSTKSCTGHLLGAAGAVEAVFSILALVNNRAPPTINLVDPSPLTKIDLVPHKAREMQIDAVLSNSFGFGGTNASLIFATPGRAAAAV